jgi:CheY-like chemotaxis protein
VPAGKAATVTATAPVKVVPSSPAEFLSWAPGRISRCRAFLPELGRITGDDGRKRVIGEMNEHVQALKAAATHPDLVSCWKVISSVEGLLKHVADKPALVNASILRTLGGSIDLLDQLCAAGPNADLLNTPPVRFLAVDDDAISRHTVSFALKRALNPPELAENGAAGLALAEANAYDAIFLDVQMPGMDGFELCRKIRAGERNRSTPIVFITCQSDFNSRAQSTLAGGCDLIGKPFVTFEVTAKALVLALSYRLKRTKPVEAQAA